MTRRILSPRKGKALGLAALVSFMLASCGDSTIVHFQTNFTGEGQQGGTLVVHTHDAPSDELQAFHVAFLSVSLARRGEATVSVYESGAGHRVELLSLRRVRTRRVHDLLTIKKDFPTGEYDRILVKVDSPEIITKGTEVVDPSHVALVDNFVAIELEAPVEMNLGEPLTVFLDFDVDRSLEKDETGWKVRPAITAEFLRGRVFDVHEDGVFEFELDDQRGFVEVEPGAQNPVFAQHMTPADFDLAPGDSVHVRGTLHPDGSVGAEQVAVGDLRQDSGASHGVSGLVSVRVAAATQLSHNRLTPIGIESLRKGQRVRMILGPTVGSRRTPKAHVAAAIDLVGE